MTTPATEHETESEQFRERLAQVRHRMAAAAARSNRSPDDVTLVGIGKTHPTSKLKLAIESGLNDLGENRVQEAESKITELGRSSARWHLVGHLQSNKARRAVQLFDVIHSLGSADLARRLDRVCEEEQRGELPVLIQVDLGGEESKTGVAEKHLTELTGVVEACAHLKLEGLMTLPPYFEEPEKVRPYFKELRHLRDRLRDEGLFGDGAGELSMGMTHDFEIAIEEGATMVRVGTAIFGERERPAV